MTKTLAYRQCILKRFTTGSELRLATWLPDLHRGQPIEVGTVLTLEGEPERVWHVSHLGSSTMSEQQLRTLQHKNAQFGASLRKRRS